MIQVRTRAELRRELENAWNTDRRIGFVPTMGYLHEGHLSLFDIARARADILVASVFVNPLQFGQGEDLDRYPRDLPRDAALAERRGVDLLFVPETAEMYAAEPAVFVDAPGLSARLCGAYRPGHFRGVLTVVAKLFHTVRPGFAVFGQKDFQQLTLIRRMVQDLDMPVEIVPGPIVREADGLALSSRNVFLSPAERNDAARLNQALLLAQLAFESGQRNSAELRALVYNHLSQGEHVRPQYVELVTQDSLDPVPVAGPGDVLALAAFVGRTRLIDNHVLTDKPV